LSRTSSEIMRRMLHHVSFEKGEAKGRESKHHRKKKIFQRISSLKKRGTDDCTL